MLSYKDIVFIINPNSGKQIAEKIFSKIKNSYPEIEVLITKDEQDFNRFMNENMEVYTVFILSGGDGTVSIGADFLSGRTDKILAIYPTGSGNGFAREFGFTKNTQRLISAALKGNYTATDILRVNTKDCTNICGIGFDSQVAHDFSKYKSRGFFSYVKAVVKVGLKFNPFSAEIAFEDQKISRDDFMMITIANTRQFGNNAIIAPHAKPNDRQLDIVMIRRMNPLRYPLLALRLMTGLIKENKHIKFIQTGAEITIRSEFKLIHTDGEPGTFEKDVKISVPDKKINILELTTD
ncbi:MAG: diacylglycerol kinase family protein [Bacteroidota bacterium]|nr:diacylglycerol kinase family protein [Bacteroidota bacterium]